MITISLKDSHLSQYIISDGDNRVLTASVIVSRQCTKTF